MAKGSGYKFVNLVTALPCTNNKVDMAIQHIKNVFKKKQKKCKIRRWTEKRKRE